MFKNLKNNRVNLRKQNTAIFEATVENIDFQISIYFHGKRYAQGNPEVMQPSD